MLCTLCPRLCRADREGGETGICGVGAEAAVAKVMIHRWEEPCFGGSAGAVFFAGCPLRCAYCQNRPISRPRESGFAGEIYPVPRLADLFLRLADEGATCLDLVSPTQFADRIASALALVKDRLTIPVVWNTGGYERTETLRTLEGLVDVYLTDLKYGSAELARAYSAAPDYPETALSALAEMVRQRPLAWSADDPGRLAAGVVVRHLVLPGGRHDSVLALKRAAETVPPEAVLLSLMRQYTPDFLPAPDPGAPDPFRPLRRRVTTFEYDAVRAEALRLGFSGYGQDPDSAGKEWTPEW